MMRLASYDIRNLKLCKSKKKKQAEQKATDNIDDILLSEFSKIQTVESEFSIVLVSRIIKNVIVKGDKSVEVVFLDGVRIRIIIYKT